MSYGKRSVILRGCPTVNEEGRTATTIKPGYLVKGVSTIAVQSADGAAPVAKAFALERDELGTGIDATYVNSQSGAGNYYYSSGDYVKVGVFSAGDRIIAFIASGENISEDDILVSAGDGSLEKIEAYSSGTGPDYPVARALESSGGAVAVATAIKVEIL